MHVFYTGYRTQTGREQAQAWVNQNASGPVGVRYSLGHRNAAVQTINVAILEPRRQAQMKLQEAIRIAGRRVRESDGTDSDKLLCDAISTLIIYASDEKEAATAAAAVPRTLSTLETCQVLVKAGYKPYEKICLAGTPECISYPFPKDNGRIGIMVRATGDPTTMVEYEIPEGVIAQAREFASKRAEAREIVP